MEVLNHLGRGQEKNLVGCEKVQPPRDLFAGGDSDGVWDKDGAFWEQSGIGLDQPGEHKLEEMLKWPISFLSSFSSSFFLNKSVFGKVCYSQRLVAELHPEMSSVI